MNLLSSLRQRWLRNHRPKLQAALTRFLYSSSNVSFGSAFRCDSIPRCLIDRSAEIRIGKEVELRDGVEIRAHDNSRIIIEDGVRIDRGVRILAANCSEIRIGSGSRIGLFSVLNGGDSIRLGNKTLVSGFVYLQTSMHRKVNPDIAIRDQGYDHGAIEIGNGAWLAAHVVVMPGISIGEGAVIGSNAVVTRNVPARVVVGGIPARPLHV